MSDPHPPGAKEGMIDALARAMRFQGLKTVPDLPWAGFDYFYQAKHFELDDEAAYRLQKMSQETALIQSLREFAIPPFPKMTFELVMKLTNKGDVQYTSALFFIDGDKWAWIYRDVDEDGHPGFFLEAGNPVSTRPNVSKVLEAQQLFIGANIIHSFCLIMQAKRVHTLVEIPKGRRLIKGKSVPYYARNEITIDLNPTRGLKRIIASGARGSPRRHGVMGHFIHRGGQKHGCIHAWEPVEREDGLKRWTCTHCDRKRTWRANFERGDAGKGYVMQKYKVTG